LDKTESLINELEVQNAELLTRLTCIGIRRHLTYLNWSEIARNIHLLVYRLISCEINLFIQVIILNYPP